MADLKTALATALQKSAVPGLRQKGQMEQIWLWIKDHPGSTVKRLKVDLRHLPPDNISSLLAQMEDRKMVTAEHVPVHPLPKFGKSLVKAYSVPVTLKTYELLPETPKVKPKKSAPKAVSRKAEKPLQPVAVPEPTVVSTPQQKTFQSQLDVKQLPVHEAMRIYRELRDIFGDLK